MYKRRSGWWREYGVYIRKVPHGSDYILGFDGADPSWREIRRFPTKDAAVDFVASVVDQFMKRYAEKLADCFIEEEA